MKVKSMKMRLELDPTIPWKETTVSVNYDPTDEKTRHYGKPVPEHRFYINLPQVVADALGRKDSRGDTQEEAIAAFKADLDTFRQLHTEKNKVILYEIKTNPSTDDKYPYRGYKVDVWAGVFNETVMIDGADNRRYSYEPLESSIKFPQGSNPFRLHNWEGKREKNLIPWSKRNEAFFVWVAERMADLVNRLDALRVPDNLIETISAGRLLPLGQSNALKGDK